MQNEFTNEQLVRLWEAVPSCNSYDSARLELFGEIKRRMVPSGLEEFSALRHEIKFTPTDCANPTDKKWTDNDMIAFGRKAFFSIPGNFNELLELFKLGK